jgi:hypothetical protein
MWTITDLKIYAANITSFSLSLTDLDLVLKIALMAATLGYTLHKWRKSRNEKKNDK